MMRVMIKGERMNGEAFSKTVMLPVGDQETGKARLEGIGIETRKEEGKILIDNVVFGSNAEKAGLDFDQEIINIQMPTDRLPKQLIFIPACALFALVYILQRRRRDEEELCKA
jgi:predicted metalloprotease with PDZ domain